MLLGACYWPGARMPLALPGFLICGGLCASIGQTYQTGADPWQLFALWAALTLPLCLGLRHDVLWTAWTVVALTAALLLSQPQADSCWNQGNSPLLSSLGSWMPALTLAFAYRFSPERATGAGLWPMRLCMIYANIGLVATASLNLVVSDNQGIYPLTLFNIACVAYAFSLPGMFDIFVFSALELIKRAVADGILPAMLEDSTRPWPIVLMTGQGGWLAAIPLFVLMFLIFKGALLEDAWCYALGLLLMAAALAVLRNPALPALVEQWSLPGLLVGGALIAYGSYRDMSYALAGTMVTGLGLATAWLVPQTWLRALLGALACATFILAASEYRSYTVVQANWNGVHFALLAWLLALAFVEANPVSGMRIWSPWNRSRTAG